MSSELLINVSPFETRIARIENGRAEEVYIERERERGTRGNIYKGRVQRVIPGIQAAFIDIGQPKAGFLYAGDIVESDQEREQRLELTQIPDNDENSNDFHDDTTIKPTSRDTPQIDHLLREGQEFIVQVSKEPIASKGPRLTSLISLAGRYLVYLPTYDHVGIARRLDEPIERARLLEIGKGLKTDTGGMIIRTAAEGRSSMELQQDFEFLQRLWQDVEQRISNAAPGSLVHMELNLYLRAMRDFVDQDVEKIHVDSREAYQRMKKFASRFMPEITDKIFYYPGERPIFDVYGVEEELDRALKRRVSLRSGGHLVIDQTEALIVIDVNSGSFVHSRNLEETSFKTNIEASHEIVHQLRLRNLGGIIVVDFIDMQDEEHRNQLISVLEEALKRDKVKTHIVQYSALGLVEMTRKRTRESLGRILMRECDHCDSTGHIKSLVTLCHQIFRELVAEARAFPCHRLMVIAHPSIIDLLLGEESDQVLALEKFTSKEISLESNDSLLPEQFEIVPL
ncbi:MAG: Rne/Rng family ribonuclease [Mariprofundaceae bacterium]